MPIRAADHTAEIAPHEVGVLVGQNISLHIAEGGFWLVPDAVVKGLNDVFLETGSAGISRDYRLALRIRELLIGDPLARPSRRPQ